MLNQLITNFIDPNSSGKCEFQQMETSLWRIRERMAIKADEYIYSLPTFPLWRCPIGLSDKIIIRIQEELEQARRKTP